MARVAVFAFDVSEAAQIRRIQCLRALGHDVVSLSFRRANMNAEFVPDWPNVPLGITENESFLRRIGQLGRALWRAWRNRGVVKGTDVWIARNFDLLVLAALLRRMTGRRDVRLVYECLDIHGLFTRKGAIGAAMQLAERRVLVGVDLLVVSSPGFLRHYFEPVQGYRGATAILENKLWLGERPSIRPTSRPRHGGPLVLGWVGSLRCAASLDILAGVARALGDDVRVVMHGNIHRHAIPNVDAILAAHPNIEYCGAYQYPDALAGIYGGCDLVWAQDLWQSGANSDWLLPNRIYEASYFGCPSIAVKGTETGRKVVRDGLGFTVDAPDAGSVVTLLQELSCGEIADAGQKLLDRCEDDFRLTEADVEMALAPVLKPVSRPSKEAA